MRPDEKLLIGWSEYVDLPDWGICGLKAKIDTGARSSALHVEDLESVGERRVKFHVILNRKMAHKRVEVRARVLRWAKVRSSTGEYAKRCFVTTTIKIGPVEKEIELSLVSRRDMLFRMLLGRKALEQDFLVDVSRRAQLGPAPKIRKRVKKQKD